MFKPVGVPTTRDGKDAKTIADFALNLHRWKGHFSELPNSAASSSAPSPVERQKWATVTAAPSVTEIFAVFKQLKKTKPQDLIIYPQNF